MAGAKQHNDMGLSWFRPWAVRPERVRSGRCIVLHRGACKGEHHVLAFDHLFEIFVRFFSFSVS
jgi:hypothetical protein